MPGIDLYTINQVTENMKSDECDICKHFHDGYEIPLSQKTDEDYQNILLLNEITLADGTSSGFYQCPNCNTYYRKTIYQEWNSFDDIMMDIEKFYPVAEADVQFLLNPKRELPHYVEINTSRCCSKCKSSDVTKINETKVENNILVWYKCLQCGNEEFMDMYQDSDDIDL